MILKDFDQLNFLLDFYKCAPPGFDHVCLRSLVSFDHPRSIGRLCDVLLNSKEPELRFIAVEVLEEIANPASLFALEYAVKNDLGKNFVDRKIADVAKEATGIIRNLSGLV